MSLTALDKAVGILKLLHRQIPRRALRKFQELYPRSVGTLLGRGEHKVASPGGGS